MATAIMGSLIFDRITDQTVVPEMGTNKYTEFYLSVNFCDDCAVDRLEPIITSKQITKLFLSINALEDSGAEKLVSCLNKVNAYPYVSINKIASQFSKSVLNALASNKNLAIKGHGISLNLETV